MDDAITGENPCVFVAIGGTGRRVLESLRSLQGLDFEELVLRPMSLTSEPSPDPEILPRVYLVGSLFGGTGAGIVPFLSLDGPFSKRVIDQVLDNPATLYRLSADQFEAFAAELYRGLGYSVSHTQRSHDGGVDLVLEKTIDGMPHRYLVQCKHTRNKRKSVGVSVVRELCGTLADYPATAGILFTNTVLSSAAWKFLRRHAHCMFGVDRDKLTALLSAYAAICA